MKRFLIAASVVAGALALGAPSANAEGKIYANPEFVTGFSGSKSSGRSLALPVGYKDGPFFIQAVPAMSNDTTSTDWGWSGKAGASGQVDDQTNIYAEVGFSKFDGSDTGSYVKTGAIIDGKKVNREEFFNTLNTWGKDGTKKFVVIHHSILSEGINVSGLEAVIFMRNMDYIGISQSIGRVIRLGSSEKTFGLVCIPTYDTVGISTARKVQAVVDVVFNQGQPAISEIRR